ncbi:MAG: hypothetical protein HC930_08210 [Hydrococcus sp. SU_1_0]|nr:hypothetical protein [Hydrococcus sp. SU_1_0]
MLWERVKKSIITPRKPIIESYPINKKNKYLTLNQWLKERKYNTKDNELVYGCWHAIVDSKEILKYEQDLLVSWFNYKIEDNKLNTKSGIVKIFNNEVKDAVITEDFLDWLFHFCNDKQRNELLNKLVIKSSIYYPSYSKVETIEELIKCYENDELESYWLAIPLDHLIIDDLIAWRSIYPKKPVKHPLNELL